MKYAFLYLGFGLAVVVAELVKEVYLARQGNYKLYVDRHDVKAIIVTLLVWPLYLMSRLSDLFK